MATVRTIDDSNSAPFDIPFEHPSGVSLAFNFWSRRTYLETEKDVCDLIASLLTGDPVDCIKNSKKARDPAKIILAVAQGVDSTVLTAEAIRTSSFFKECSSVPINQQHRLEIHSRNSRAAPTDNIYSTLLWPEKPPSPFSEMKYFLSKELFEQFTLKFQVIPTFQQWQQSPLSLCWIILPLSQWSNKLHRMNTIQSFLTHFLFLLSCNLFIFPFSIFLLTNFFVGNTHWLARYHYLHSKYCKWRIYSFWLSYSAKERFSSNSSHFCHEKSTSKERFGIWCLRIFSTNEGPWFW